MTTSLRWLPIGLWMVSLVACGGSDSDTEGGGPGGGSGGSATGGQAGKGAQGGSAGLSGSSGQSGQAGASAGQAGKGGGGAGGQAGAGGAKAGSGGTSGGAGVGGGTAGQAGQAGVSGGGGMASGGKAGAGGGVGGEGGIAGTSGQGGEAGMSGGGQAGAGGAPPCGGCMEGFVCKYDTCVPDLGTCTTNDDCPGDSYCDVDQTCVPYGVPPTKTNDPTCEKPQVPVAVSPAVQCEWLGPSDPKDVTAKYTEIYTTPVAADLNLDLDPKKIQPSIIVSTFASLPDGVGRTSMLRVFDGRTCQEQMRIGGPDDPEAASNRPTYAAHWAVGDLDGDVGKPGGHPEIVGLHRVGLAGDTDAGQVIAFGVDTTNPKAPKLVRRWLGRDCKNGNKAVTLSNNTGSAGLGLMLHDLDDDGVPEVLAERMVFDAKGCALNPTTKIGNLFSAVADVDLDGKPDLVRFDGVYGWDTAKKDWVVKPWSVPTPGLAAGHVAVVDVGFYSEIPGHKKTDKLPEIIVVSAGQAWIVTLTGAPVFGPFPVYDNTGLPAGENKGGAPTAADFDGDGEVEFATAGATFYSVYDPDCLAKPDKVARPNGVCKKADKTLPEGILWAQPSQDKSSNVTGSSVFDFNGDGKAEVVYRDECFLRVYDGPTGKVLYSAPASSGTGWEYPIIADIDGDFATEIVAPRTHFNGCPKGPDKLYPTSGDAVSSTGFVVLRDPQDRWVSSRPIWNQHAYSITHVTDDARIPKSSEVKRNWEQPGLNNFRQNTQGSLKATALADLTVELQDADQLCAGTAGSFEVKAKVCNRGTNPVQDGAQVLFSQKDANGVVNPLCSTATDTLLQPGDCTVVSCKGELSEDSDVLVAVDPAAQIADCHPGNNEGASARILCGKP